MASMPQGVEGGREAETTLQLRVWAGSSPGVSSRHSAGLAPHPPAAALTPGPLCVPSCEQMQACTPAHPGQRRQEQARASLCLPHGAQPAYGSASSSLFSPDPMLPAQRPALWTADSSIRHEDGSLAHTAPTSSYNRGTSTYIYTHVCVYVCVYLHPSVYTCACGHTHTHTYASMCTCVYM